MTTYLPYNDKVPCCGVFCGGCSFYTREKRTCNGASTRCVERKCGFYKCCVEKKGLQFCHECKTFPCSHFRKFAETWLKLGQDLVENQKLLAELGEAGFLQYYNLKLKSIEDSDVEQLGTWLNKEHVLKWYHDADECLNEIKDRNVKFCFLNHFVVLIENKPIGFGQYYDCFHAKEDWYSVNNPNALFSIDYFIGEETYLRKGYGNAIVKLLVAEIYKQSSEVDIVVQPEQDNIASCKALLSGGFVYDENKGYYILKGIKDCE